MATLYPAEDPHQSGQIKVLIFTLLHQANRAIWLRTEYQAQPKHNPKPRLW